MIESYFLYLHCTDCDMKTEPAYNNIEGEMKQLIDGYMSLRVWLNFWLLDLRIQNRDAKEMVDFLAVHHLHNVVIASDVPGWELEQ